MSIQSNVFNTYKPFAFRYVKFLPFYMHVHAIYPTCTLNNQNGEFAHLVEKKNKRSTRQIYEMNDGRIWMSHWTFDGWIWKIFFFESLGVSKYKTCNKIELNILEYCWKTWIQYCWVYVDVLFIRKSIRINMSVKINKLKDFQKSYHIHKSTNIII